MADERRALYIKWTEHTGCRHKGFEDVRIVGLAQVWEPFHGSCALCHLGGMQ